jgi:hypothetical protein
VWQSCLSKVLSKLPVSQPTAAPPVSQPTTAPAARSDSEPVSRRSASQPLAGLTASKQREAAKKPVAAASFFSRVAVLNPSPTLPRRKLALPRGGLLHSDQRDDEVARPSSSRRQHTSRFPPLLLQFSRKNRLWPSLARLCLSQPAHVAVKSLISRIFCVKMSFTLSRPSGGSTPL